MRTPALFSDERGRQTVAWSASSESRRTPARWLANAPKRFEVRRDAAVQPCENVVPAATVLDQSGRQVECERFWGCPVACFHWSGFPRTSERSNSQWCTAGLASLAAQLKKKNKDSPWKKGRKKKRKKELFEARLHGFWLLLVCIAECDDFSTLKRANQRTKPKKTTPGGINYVMGFMEDVGRAKSEVAMSRVDKHAEFFAHNSKINCACIDNLVYATGASDGRIHIWKIIHNDQKPIKALVGGSKPIDSVKFGSGFDTKKRTIASGSRSGTLRLWDLAKEKIMATFAEHRASISCIDFHPTETKISSASVDTNIKVWDVRKRNSYMTLKGHEDPVTALKHSPDGKWIISGDAGGYVKVWDLAKGSVLSQWKMGSGVTSMALCPSEQTMACATEKKTIRFFDLENFDILERTTVNPTRIHSIAFHKDGKTLLSASSSGLKTWGWNPMKMHDHVEIEWQNVADMTVTSSDVLYTVGFKENLVQTTDVRLYKMEPFRAAHRVGGRYVSPKVHGGSSSSGHIEQDLGKMSIKGTSVSATKSTPAVSQEVKEKKSVVIPHKSEKPIGTKELEPERRSKHSELFYLGLDMSAFLSCRQTLDTNKVLTDLSKDHVKFKGILIERTHQLRLVRSYWVKGDVKGALDKLIDMNNRSVQADFLKNAEKQMQSALNLEMSRELLPILTSLLTMPFEGYLKTSLSYLRFILKSFSPVIKSTLLTTGKSSLVNPQFEERRTRCKECLKWFAAAKPNIKALSTKNASIQRDAVEVLDLIQALIQTKEQRIISMWFYFAIAITLRRISRVSVRICTKYSCSIVVWCGINIFFSEGHPQEPSFA
eukprot:jgi/Bigna1/88199/estExt_fgenesh1_pg.C_290053